MPAQLESVDSLIARVEKKHPGEGKWALATYFREVHQELAPLARALERENAALREQLQAQWRARGRETRSRLRTVYTCPCCGNVYSAGDAHVTIYAQNGAANCRVCPGAVVMREHQIPWSADPAHTPNAGAPCNENKEIQDEHI